MKVSAHRKQETGSTIVECLLAVAVLALIAIPSVQSIGDAWNGQAEQIKQAMGDDQIFGHTDKAYTMKPDGTILTNNDDDINGKNLN